MMKTRRKIRGGAPPDNKETQFYNLLKQRKYSLALDLVREGGIDPNYEVLGTLVYRTRENNYPLLYMVQNSQVHELQNELGHHRDYDEYINSEKHIYENMDTIIQIILTFLEQGANLDTPQNSIVKESISLASKIDIFYDHQHGRQDTRIIRPLDCELTIALLEKGLIDPNKLIHAASSTLQSKLLKRLLEKGANPSLPSQRQGKLPLDVVGKYINEEINTHKLKSKHIQIILGIKKEEIPEREEEVANILHQAIDRTSGPLNLLNSRNIKEGSEDALLFSPIEDGNIMVNFGNSQKHGRYYKKKNWNTYRRSKRDQVTDPYTREPVKNVEKYKAKIIKKGGTRKIRKV